MGKVVADSFECLDLVLVSVSQDEDREEMA